MRVYQWKALASKHVLLFGLPSTMAITVPSSDCSSYPDKQGGDMEVCVEDPQKQGAGSALRIYS